MELIFHDTKTHILEALNIIFIKWWQVGTGLIFTWITAFFGQNIMLFITPEFAKAWIPIVISLVIGLVTIFFLYRKKNKELKQLDEKHTQEMFQDEMEDCRKMWVSFLENKRIPDTTTLVDFKKEHYDKIKLAFSGQQNTHK